LASTVHAQNGGQARAMTNSPSIGGGQSVPSWGTGGSWGSINSPIGRNVSYEPPREYFLEYATNDGPFVPSTYMNYEDALALGRQQLAVVEKETTQEPAVSLGEAARALRAEKVPTFRLRSRVLQDNAGKLHICNLNGNDCRRL
jgi:hypothetical protein